LYRMARALFQGWRADHKSTSVRLLGMGVSGLEEAGFADHSAGDQADSASEQNIDRVLDSIHRRFGAAGVVHGQTLRRKKT
jgi:hypothetical protein